MLHIVNHPLITMKLNKMRDKDTSSKDFRTLLDEISSLMTFEVFKDLKLHPTGKKYHTPLGQEIDKLDIDYNIVIAPILRAGIGMSNGVVNMLPTARIGHIGLYRNEKTLEPVEYFCKLPKVENPLLLICYILVLLNSQLMYIQYYLFQELLVMILLLLKQLRMLQVS